MTEPTRTMRSSASQAAWTVAVLEQAVVVLEEIVQSLNELRRMLSEQEQSK
jgi:hypothetical protein